MPWTLPLALPRTALSRLIQIRKFRPLVGRQDGVERRVARRLNQDLLRRQAADLSRGGAQARVARYRCLQRRLSGLHRGLQRLQTGLLGCKNGRRQGLLRMRLAISVNFLLALCRRVFSPAGLP